MPYTREAYTECSRLSNVIERITNDVTKALERKVQCPTKNNPPVLTVKL